MFFGFFLTLGVAVLSVALRSFQSSFAQKAGALGILVASYLAVYFVTGSWILGVAAAASWLFLPWLEILTRIRALRLPKEKQLRPKSPPSTDIFPTLNDITREIENAGLRNALEPATSAFGQTRRGEADSSFGELGAGSWELGVRHV